MITAPDINVRKPNEIRQFKQRDILIAMMLLMTHETNGETS